jgi:hypothetical protein
MDAVVCVGSDGLAAGREVGGDVGCDAGGALVTAGRSAGPAHPAASKLIASAIAKTPLARGRAGRGNGEADRESRSASVLRLLGVTATVRPRSA